jgi:hypothetical protein
MATDSATAIRDYLKSIQDALARGDSTDRPPDGGDRQGHYEVAD